MTEWSLLDGSSPALLWHGEDMHQAGLPATPADFFERNSITLYSMALIMLSLVLPFVLR